MFAAGFTPRPHLTQAAKAAALAAYVADRRTGGEQHRPLISRHGRPYLPVDSDVPRPMRKGTPWARPFAMMKIGDSFFEPCAGVSIDTLTQRVKWDAKHHRPARFDMVTMVQDGETGLRVWRVA